MNARALLLAALALAASGCEGEATTSPDGTSTASASSSAAAAGGAGGDTGSGGDTGAGGGGGGSGGAGGAQLTVTTASIAGEVGKVVVIFLHDGNVGAALGTYCESLDADPDEASGPISVKNGAMNPCDTGGPLDVPLGAHQIFAGIYTPGSQTPEKCTEAPVTVLGDTSITLPPFGTCN